MGNKIIKTKKSLANLIKNKQKSLSDDAIQKKLLKILNSQNNQHKKKPINERLLKTIHDLQLKVANLKAILDNMAQGLIYINSEGLIITYNAAAEIILNKPESEVLNRVFWEVFEDDLFNFSISTALKTGKAPGTQFISLTLQDGRVHELEVSTSFTFSEDNKPALILMIRDITEYRRLQREANRSDRMKELGVLASMVAHEIRNPLGGIKGFASLLAEDLADNPSSQEMAKKIIKGTDELNTFVSNVLDYSRPLTLNKKKVKLKELIEDACLLAKSHRSYKDSIEIKTSYSNDVDEITIDPQLIRSSILNIIINAIQAIDDKGVISIDVKKEKRDVVITISDNGKGIDPKHLSKIFTLFFTTKHDGNGFGLAEVYKIIDGHNGKISVESKVGQGTKFTISLPLG